LFGIANYAILEYIGEFDAVYEKMILNHKSDYVKVGPRLANCMSIVIPKDKKNSDTNPTKYRLRSIHHEGCSFKLELHQFQMIAKLRAYVGLGIADETMQDAWQTFMNGDFLGHDWYDVSHLTGKKRDFFNLIAEKNKPNNKRKKCTSRCKCKCGNEISAEAALGGATAPWWAAAMASEDARGNCGG
jgi:hypothetical protein